MSRRPVSVVTLIRGLAIGAARHRAFAATFNWMRSFIDNFKVGKGLALEGKNDGNPIIKGDSVYDVYVRENAPTQSGGSTTRTLVVEYEDENEAAKEYDISSSGPGGAASITIEGTDGSTATGSQLIFAAAENSNVIVTVRTESRVVDGVTTEVAVAEVGVRYI